MPASASTKRLFFSSARAQRLPKCKRFGAQESISQQNAQISIFYTFAYLSRQYPGIRCGINGFLGWKKLGFHVNGFWVGVAILLAPIVKPADTRFELSSSLKAITVFLTVMCASSCIRHRLERFIPMTTQSPKTAKSCGLETNHVLLFSCVLRAVKLPTTIILVSIRGLLKEAGNFNMEGLSA